VREKISGLHKRTLKLEHLREPGVVSRLGKGGEKADQDRNPGAISEASRTRKRVEGEIQKKKDRRPERRTNFLVPREKKWRVSLCLEERGASRLFWIQSRSDRKRLLNYRD